MGTMKTIIVPNTECCSVKLPCPTSRPFGAAKNSEKGGRLAHTVFGLKFGVSLMDSS